MNNESYAYLLGNKLNNSTNENNSDLFTKLNESYKEENWLKVTGINPRESKFILATPIYNEEKMGLNCIKLATILSDIPRCAHVWNIYVTNRCTDNSYKIILNHLSTLGYVRKVPIYELGQISDPKIDAYYYEVMVGNQRHILINTQTPSKSNVWKILTAIGYYNDIKIVMSYDTNVGLLSNAPVVLFSEAYKSFIKKEDSAVIISAVTKEYIDPDKLDTNLQHDKISPRQILPFGLLVPESHRVNGKFAAWDAEFYFTHEILPCKLDDVVMAKQANIANKTFKHINQTLSYEWGVPSLNWRVKMLERYTTGYLQMVNLLNLGEICPEFKFFESKQYRDAMLEELLGKSKKLYSYLAITKKLWDSAIKRGYQEFYRNPSNPAFEPIENVK